MKITDVKIRKVLEDQKLKAVVSVTFDDSLCVHDIKIIQNEGKIFLAMPSKKTNTGQFKDTVHPINREFRENLEKVVLERYENEINNINNV